MGAANDDLSPDEKKRRAAGLMPRLANGEPSGGAAWEAAMSDVSKQKEADEAESKAGQAARDLKTKRAAEGKIRY